MGKKLFITDTILRDAHQSQAATRMRVEDMLPACELLDSIGYWSLECWGGATFDSCLRFLNEDPWDRLRKLRKPRKRYARFGVDGVVRCAQTQLRELLGANDADIKPLLGDYEVRALADDERQHLVHVQVVKHLRHFPNVLGCDERSDLAADLERAV